MMKMRVFKVTGLILCAPVFLAACGGGGGATNQEPVDFSTADAAAMALIDTYVDASGDPAIGQTRSNSFATPGRVDYSGAVRGALGGNPVVGDLSVSVAFDTNDVTGSARNFQNEVTGAYSGTLSGSGDVDADADPNLPQMTLVLEGDLTNGGGAQSATLLLDGNFFAHGGNPEGAVAGSVDGTIGGVLFEDGLFAAEE